MIQSINDEEIYNNLSDRDYEAFWSILKIIINMGSPQPYFVIAQDDKIIFISEILCKLLDYTPKELKLIPFSQLVHPNGVFLVEDIPPKFPEGEIIEYSCRLFKKDKSFLWFLWYILQLSDQDYLYAVGIEIYEPRFEI